MILLTLYLLKILIPLILVSYYSSISSTSYSTRTSLVFKNIYLFAPVLIKALNYITFLIKLSL
jgi:hypothetical protein